MDYINIDLIEGYTRESIHSEVAKLLKEESLDLVNKKTNLVIVQESIYSKYIKRILDIIISFLALILTMPINMGLLVITLIDVGFPIFYSDLRCGKNGKLFYLTKFRNMTNQTDSNGNLLPPSQRVTRIGSFIREKSLDEFLNFWNILKGDMSIIGPRPLQPAYTDRYSNRHRQRLNVKPGLENPIINRKSTKPCGWYEQFENDVWYVENISFRTDIKQFFNLISFVFDKKYRSINGRASEGGFMGYTHDGKCVNSHGVPKYIVDKAILNLMERNLL